MHTTQFIITKQNTDINGKMTYVREMNAHDVFYEGDESYVKTYERLELPLSMVCVTSARMFFMISQMMSYAENGQRVRLDKEKRETLRMKLGVSVPMFDRCLRELVDVLLIKRVVRGTYAVNPWYASRGKWKHVRVLREEFDILVDMYGNDRIVVDKESDDERSNGD